MLVLGDEIECKQSIRLGHLSRAPFRITSSLNLAQPSPKPQAAVIMKVVDAVKNDVRTDVTWNKVGRLTTKAARALPSASARYMIDKVPIVGWLPRYNVRWLVNDTIAGLTLGLMLIPQGLSYASLATIPIQYGLMSSWFPSALYAFMGTTKGE